MYDSESLYNLIIIKPNTFATATAHLAVFVIPKLLVIRNYHILSYKSYYKYYDHDHLMNFLFLKNVSLGSDMMH